MAPVLVLACGNPSRGDDALGPALIERLESVPGLALDLLTDFQLQIEHALDLVGRERVVFVDAALAGPEPFAFTRVVADAGASFTTHSMSPGAVLRVYRQFTGAEPPDSWLLAVRGYRFEMGEGLSSGARANLDAGVGHLIGWLQGGGDPAA